MLYINETVIFSHIHYFIYLFIFQILQHVFSFTDVYSTTRTSTETTRQYRSTLRYIYTGK